MHQERSGVDERLNVLVPADKLASSRSLMDVAGALLDAHGGTGTILGVVTVPEERSLSEGALLARRRRELLRRAAAVAEEGRFAVEVRSARTLQGGIREAVGDRGADILLLNWRPGSRTPVPVLEDLVEDPPCDLALVREGRSRPIRNVLVPARGGPHARLALRLAEAFAERHDAVLTLMHISGSHWSDRRREIENRYFEIIRNGVAYANVRMLQIEAESVEAALLKHGADSDVVVMGAAARDQASAFLLGRIPAVIAEGVDAHVIVVKTREPVTGSTFAGRALDQMPHDDISTLVDRWFAENTFHSREFRGLRALVDLKERQGLTISLALPTLNEEKTVGPILQAIKGSLVDRIHLVDELIVVDSNSTDRTVEIAESLGVQVYQHAEILPRYGSFRGKGEGLWKSLYVTRGDIIVWIDSDITGIHPKFVYGLIGPLLSHPHIGFVKGFYRRPLNLDGQVTTTGGGRVTELTARPLINLFYPRLSGLVQPLAGEMAGRRVVLESIPFFTGYGVETGLLIDILEQFGLRSIAQTDLDERVHRNQSLFALSKMAFAIVQVVIERLGERQRLQLIDEISTTMKLIHYSPDELYLQELEIRENERPPMNTLEEYMARSRDVNGLR
jgi:glycosyltransferase involved in cell wall biosynthesis/nucleotide-binding universal stress UspA family protein